jgi:hypothetical protein
MERMEKKTIDDLLKKAEKERKKLDIKPRKFESDENGSILLDPNKKFDKDWYENDEAYDIL